MRHTRHEVRVQASGLRYRALTAWTSLSVRRSALKLEIEAKAHVVAGIQPIKASCRSIHRMP